MRILEKQNADRDESDNVLLVAVLSYALSALLFGLKSWFFGFGGAAFMATYYSVKALLGKK